MKIIWTPEAEQDRFDICDAIAIDDPMAAVRMDNLFEDAVQSLSEYPRLGKPGQIAGTRELEPHPSYRLVHQTKDNIVWILAVIHTTRPWPTTT